jgi:hypothetical protein
MVALNQYLVGMFLVFFCVLLSRFICEAQRNYVLISMVQILGDGLEKAKEAFFCLHDVDLACNMTLFEFDLICFSLYHLEFVG